VGRTIAAGVQTELDNLGAETHSVLQINLAGGGDPLLYSTLEDYIDGDLYDGTFLQSGDLVQTIDGEPNRIDVTLSNADKVQGLKFKNEELVKAQAIFGRYYVEADVLVSMYEGTVVPKTVDQGEAKIEVVSDLVAAGYCVAQFTAAPQCQAPYKHPVLCGYAGVKTSCSKWRKGPNSCQEHDVPTDEPRFFGLEYPYGLFVEAPTGGDGGLSGGWEDPCFPAGTVITMADLSHKPIEEIRRGDLVLAFDPRTLELKVSRVRGDLQIHKADRLLSIDGGAVQATPNHKFYTGYNSRGYYEPVEDLRPGDKIFRLRLPAGSTPIEKGEPRFPPSVDVFPWEIESRRWLDLREEIDVFNFEVEIFHNYFANRFAVSNRKDDIFAIKNMPYFDLLKKNSPQNIFIALAYGYHVLTGFAAKGYVSGSSPTHQLTLQNILGLGSSAGGWDSLVELYYAGVKLDPATYIFYPGAKATAATTSTIFAADVPHSLKAWVEATLPVGVGPSDPIATAPDDLVGFFKTRKCRNYNSSGTVTDAGSYTTNPARIVADLLLEVGRLPSSRIDWVAWVAWRDFCDALISHNYTLLDSGKFRGFGLTGRYYSDVAFTTEVAKRVDPAIDFGPTAGAGASGQGVDNFSIKWTGYIRPRYTETYTIKVTVDNSAIVKINGSTIIDTNGSPVGTYTATIALTGGTFYAIEVDFVESSGPAECILKWSSATQAEEVIPEDVLFPETENRARYEINPFWATRTRLDDALRTCLVLCNSTYQEANGKYKFFAFDQLSAGGFTLTNDDIKDGTLTFTPRDPLTVRNFWSAVFRPVYSRYLETVSSPVTYEIEELVETAGRRIEGADLDFFNSTHHQVYTVLKAIADRSARARFEIEVDALPQAFGILAGDRGDVTVEFMDNEVFDCLVHESRDLSGEQTPDERRFILREWTD
jgi:hypothetical protein